MVDFDYVLDKIGSFGRYQVLVYFSLLYVGIPIGLNGIASVFISYTPEYRCLMYPFDNRSLHFNLSNDEIKNISTPLNKDGDVDNPCVRYGYNATECAIRGDLSCVNKSAGTVECEDYYYDDKLFSETVATEFDLVCERRVLDSIASSMYMVGYLIGSIFGGNTADRYGRKFTTVASGFAMLISMLGVAYSSTLVAYIITRCLVATFVMGMNIAIFSHLMEIVGTEWRTWVGMGYQISTAAGYMFWSGIAYLYRDWHHMQLAAVVACVPLAIILLVVPESPRWLFTNGCYKRGMKVTRLMARLNETDLSDVIWEEGERVMKNGQKKRFSTEDLFLRKGMRNLTIKLGFVWAVISMVYYGVSLNAGSLAGDVFLNNLYAGIMDITGTTICCLIMNYSGRRLLLAANLTLGGLALLASTIINEYAENQGLMLLGVTFAFLGKGVVHGAFAVIYNFTGESYPTVVRANGVGFGSMCARIGSIISPFIIGIQDHVSWAPNMIFGIFALLGGALSLTFRDTTGVNMMETIEEAEAFYSGRKAPSQRLSKDAHHNRKIKVDEDHGKEETAL